MCLHVCARAHACTHTFTQEYLSVCSRRLCCYRYTARGVQNTKNEGGLLSVSAIGGEVRGEAPRQDHLIH